MTDKNRTEVAVIVDRSGSMMSIREDAEGGLNSFLKKMQKAKGEVVLTLAQFDNHYDLLVRRCSIRDSLPEFKLSPRGTTALYDAVGRTVQTLGEDLANLPEGERPGKVLVLIVTDGLENASREFKPGDVQEMIRHQKEKYGWEFLYIGANQDAIEAGGKLGIDKDGSVNYKGSSRGVRAMYSAVTSGVMDFADTGDSKSLRSERLSRGILAEEAKIEAEEGPEKREKKGGNP